MPEITVGPAREQHYGELMAMLDDVFFLEDSEPKRDFLRLLPKLYKKEYRPWDNNYCVWEGGVLKAAVGMYVRDVEIAGEPLRVGGIGNVAVARDCRRKGYMKLAMDAAMDAMRAAGCDFGELGGQRQRYQFWGFERGGVAVDASFSEKNLRHAYGENALDPLWRAERIRSEDSETLARVQAFIESEAIHYKHSPGAFYDALCSWNETPCAIWRGDSLEGFFTLSRDKKNAGQFRLRAAANLEMAVRAVYAILPENDHGKRVGLTIPLWRTDLLRLAEEISEGCDIDDTGMYTFLRWGRMLRALLKLQAMCKPLADGQLCVRIQGFCGEETLCVSVQGGEPSVSACAGEPEQTFTHLQALRYFLAPHSVLRHGDTLAQNWFPLPLCLMGIDTV